jgi:RNase P subunit RPR2
MGSLQGRMICPNCGTNTTFVTTAHVTQDWEVDSEGEFISVVKECCDDMHRPDVDNIWTCTKCGAEGVYNES